MLRLVPLSALGLLSSVLPLVAGQLFTECNPLNETCPPDPAFGTKHEFIFNDTQPEGLWETTAGKVEFDAEKGAIFTVAKQGVCAAVGITALSTLDPKADWVAEHVFEKQEFRDAVEWMVAGALRR